MEKGSTIIELTPHSLFATSGYSLSPHLSTSTHTFPLSLSPSRSQSGRGVRYDRISSWQRRNVDECHKYLLQVRPKPSQGVCQLSQIPCRICHITSSCLHPSAVGRSMCVCQFIAKANGNLAIVARHTHTNPCHSS